MISADADELPALMEIIQVNYGACLQAACARTFTLLPSCSQFSKHFFAFVLERKRRGRQYRCNTATGHLGKLSRGAILLSYISVKAASDRT